MWLGLYLYSSWWVCLFSIFAVSPPFIETTSSTIYCLLPSSSKCSVNNSGSKLQPWLSLFSDLKNTIRQLIKFLMLPSRIANAIFPLQPPILDQAPSSTTNMKRITSGLQLNNGSWWKWSFGAFSNVAGWSKSSTKKRKIQIL